MTAPLTAEVVAQMVTRLRGQDAIPNRNEVADMLTALATQLAERDRRIAALTEAANRFCDAFANLENRGSGDANAKNRQWHTNWQERSDAYHALRQALTITTDKEPTT